MASNPATTVRLRPILLAYIDELASIGGYGKGRAGVMRRFIENGIVRAIETRVIEKKDAANFGESVTDDEDD
jgi:hypothetical protein